MQVPDCVCSTDPGDRVREKYVAGAAPRCQAHRGDQFRAHLARRGLLVLAMCAAVVVSGLARDAGAVVGVSAVVGAQSDPTIHPGLAQNAGSWSITVDNSLKVVGMAHFEVELFDSNGANCSAIDASIGFGALPAVVMTPAGPGPTPAALLSSSTGCAASGVQDIVGFDVTMVAGSFTIAINKIVYDVGSAIALGAVQSVLSAACVGKAGSCNPPFASLSSVTCPANGCSDAFVAAAVSGTGTLGFGRFTPPLLSGSGLAGSGPSGSGPSGSGPPLTDPEATSTTSRRPDRTTTSAIAILPPTAGSGDVHQHHDPDRMAWGLIAEIGIGVAALAAVAIAWRRRMFSQSGPSSSPIATASHVDVQWDWPKLDVVRSPRGGRALPISVRFDQSRRVIHLETP